MPGCVLYSILKWGGGSSFSFVCLNGFLNALKFHAGGILVELCQENVNILAIKLFVNEG